MYQNHHGIDISKVIYQLSYHNRQEGVKTEGVMQSLGIPSKKMVTSVNDQNLSALTENKKVAFSCNIKLFIISIVCPQ